MWYCLSTHGVPYNSQRTPHSLWHQSSPWAPPCSPLSMPEWISLQVFCISPAGCISIGDGQRYGLISWWMLCTLPCMCHLCCHNTVPQCALSESDKWRTVAEWGGESVLKSPSTNAVWSADREIEALNQSVILSAASLLLGPGTYTIYTLLKKIKGILK